MNRFLLAIVLLFICASSLRAEEERIFIDAKINGKPVRFAFDTGTSVSFLLYSTAIEKFGLKVTPPPPDHQPGLGEIAFGWTDLALLDFGITNAITRLGVVETPMYLKWPEDGTLGWRAISNNIFSIDCINHEIIFLTNTPEASVNWIKFHIRTMAGTLALEQPGDKGVTKVIAIDSGSPGGVELSPQLWHAWKVNHTNQPATMLAYHTPNLGLVVSEEIWAHEISIGPLILTEVPLMQANSSDIDSYSSGQTQFQATLGFGALKRIEVIIDGQHGIAYLRPRRTPSLPYEQDRLGAAFVPRDPINDDLVAHVADRSPAYEVGIRNGDVLLKIGELDVTKWQTDANVLPLSRFWDSPAGTKLELTLKRGDKVFTTTAVLRNILPPDPPKNSN